MKQTIKLVQYAACLLMLALLTGCIWPHTTMRSSEVRGRVLDAKTRLPIEGAKVFFVQRPPHPTYTDAAGYFHLKTTRNFHFAYLPPEGDWPERKDSAMQISHTNYIPLGGSWSGDVGDILLKPKP